MQLRSVAGETHAVRTGAGGDHYSSPGKSASRLNFFHVCGGPALQRILPAPAPAARPSAPPCTVGDLPPPGLPAQHLPGRGSRLLTPRSGPGACSLPQPGSLCRLLAAASIWPRRTRRGEGGSRRGSAAPGRRPRGGRSGRRRPNLAAQAGRCHSASPPPAAARGGVGEARPPGGRVLQGPGECGRRARSLRRGPGALRGSLLTLSQCLSWTRAGGAGGKKVGPWPRKTAGWRVVCGAFKAEAGGTSLQVLISTSGNCKLSQSLDAWVQTHPPGTEDTLSNRYHRYQRRFSQRERDPERRPTNSSHHRPQGQSKGQSQIARG